MDFDTIVKLIIGIILTLGGIVAFVILNPVIVTLVFAAICGAGGMAVGSIVAYVVAPGNQDILNILGFGGALFCIVMYYAAEGVEYIKTSYR